MYSLLVNITEEQSGGYIIKDVANTLGLMAAYVRREAGHAVGLLDLAYKRLPESTKEIREKIMKSSDGECPSVIGVAFRSTSLHTALITLTALDQAFPHATIAAIGYHAAASPLETIKSFPMIDVVLAHQVEANFLSLVDGIRDGSIKKNTFHRSPGRMWEGTETPTIQQDLDWLPLFPWDMFRAYLEESQHLPVLVSSRGCLYNCSFCGASQWLEKRWRGMSPGRMIKEIQHTIACLHPPEVYFWDEIFTFDRQRVVEFCHLTENVVNMPRWGCQTRADAVDPELLTLMSRSRCHLVGYGVESVDDEIRNGLYGKELAMSTITEAIEETNKRNMKSTACFLIGPFDTRRSLRLTADFIASMKPYYAYLMRLNIYEEMRLMSRLEEEGLISCDEYGRKDWFPKENDMASVLFAVVENERWSLELWNMCRHWAFVSPWRDQFFQKLRDFQVEYLTELGRGKDTTRARTRFVASVEALAEKAST